MNSLKRCEPSSSAGFGGMRPAAAARDRNALLPDARARRGVADHQIGQPRLLPLLEASSCSTRPAHVGVDEQHALARLRQRDGQIRRDQVLPSPGAGAGHRRGCARLPRPMRTARSCESPERLGRSSAGTPLLISGSEPVPRSRSGRAPARGTAGPGASRSRRAS